MQNKRITLKKILNEVKFGVIAIDILMTLYALWLICTNQSTPIPGILFGYTPPGALILLHASNLFNLCNTHKCMIVHSLCVYVCSLYHLNIGFDPIPLSIMRWVMFLWGLVLVIELYIRKYRERCC